MRPTKTLQISAALILAQSLCLAGEPAVESTESIRTTTSLATVIPNFHRVSDDLFRSAQPSEAGMAALHAAGIRTILNLRSFHSDRDEIARLPLRYEHLTMKAWHPEWKEAVAFLRLVSDPEQTPVLMHCQHGADRTGALCAIYRICIEGGSKEWAIREMTEGPYGFHAIWCNLPAWIRGLDIERLEREAFGRKVSSRDRSSRENCRFSP